VKSVSVWGRVGVSAFGKRAGLLGFAPPNAERRTPNAERFSNGIQ